MYINFRGLNKLTSHLALLVISFYLVYYLVHPLFSRNLDPKIALETALGTYGVHLIIIAARRFTAKKVRSEIDNYRKKSNLWTQTSAQVILYLMIVLTVYSFITKLE